MRDDLDKCREVREAVKEDLDADNSAVVEVSRLPLALNGRGCKVSALGLTLDSGITYSKYAALIRHMDQIAYAHSVRDCLFKFYIGDAFNQGESQLGEQASQIYNKLHWTQGYISNIQWICRAVPEANRDIKICNWKFWMTIAPLDHEEQKHWVSEALECMKMDETWSSEIKTRIESWKMNKELLSIKDEGVRDKARDVALADGASWGEVRNWATTGRIPKKKKSAAEWWSEELDSEKVEGDARTLVFDMAMRYAEDVKNGKVKH